MENDLRPDNNLRFLGLAKKAGLLAIGDESVLAAVRAGRVKLVITAADTSESSKKRARRHAQSGAAYMAVPYTKAELGAVIGRGTPGIVGILDSGMAESFLEGMKKRV